MIRSGKVKKVFQVLSSKECLLWLIGAWIAYYVFSAIWGKEAFAFFIGKEVFAGFVSALRQRLLFKIPFIIFLVCWALNLVRASRSVFRENRAGFFLWIVLPAGALVFLTGFFISITTRNFEWIIVGEGHGLTPPGSTEEYRVMKIDPGFKEKFLDIDLDSGKGIFKYEPKVTIRNSQGKEFTIGAFPPSEIHGVYFHLLNFGLAPGIRVLERGSVLDQGYMVLRIIQPGSSDTFELPEYPYRFIISLEPEKVFQKGNTKASEFNLKDPVYHVRVYSGEKLIREGISRDGITLGNTNLEFMKPAYWAQIEIVKDRGVHLLLSGLFLMVIGIPLYFIGVFVRSRNRKSGEPGGKETGKYSKVET